MMRYQKTVATFLIPILLVHCSEASLLSSSSAQGERRRSEGGEESEADVVPASLGKTLRLRPQDLSEDEAKELGKLVLKEVGYENLIQLALKTGLIEPQQEVESSAESENGIQPISYGYLARAGYVFTKWAVSAGLTSQMDSPVPGPGDVVAAGMLLVGVVDALILGGMIIEKANESGELTAIKADAHWKTQNKLSDEQMKKLVEDVRDLVNSWMAKGGHQNVKDSGIVEEMHALRIAQGFPDSKEYWCRILKLMWEAANDTTRERRIRATQKGFNCTNIGKQR